MESELKTYLEGMEGRITDQFNEQFKSVRTEVADVLEVVQNVSENTASIISTFKFIK